MMPSSLEKKDYGLGITEHFSPAASPAYPHTPITLTKELLDFGLVEPVMPPSPEKKDYGLGITEHFSPVALPAHLHPAIMLAKN